MCVNQVVRVRHLLYRFCVGQCRPAYRPHTRWVVQAGVPPPHPFLGFKPSFEAVVDEVSLLWLVQTFFGATPTMTTNQMSKRNEF
eukprot:5001595-Amphidinium_carterae.1